MAKLITQKTCTVFLIATLMPQIVG